MKQIETENTIDYFLLLFSHCYNEPKNLYKLFLYFPKVFKINDKDNNLADLTNDIEIIYKDRNNIFNSIKLEINKDKDDGKSKKLKDKFENLFYYIIIYFYLLINNITKALELIEELHKNNKLVLFHILKHYSSSLKQFDFVSVDLANEILSDITEKDFNNMKNILYFHQKVLVTLELLNNNKNYLKELSNKDDKNNIINILDYIKQNKKEDNIPEICQKINDLIEYQKTEQAFFIDFKPDFWKYYYDNYNNCNLEEINALIELRKTMKKYNELINTNTKDVPKKTKKDFNVYFSKDDYGSSIHNKIIINIENNKYTNNKYTKSQLLTLIFEKDPYYNDDSNRDKREISILKYFDFKRKDNEDFFLEDNEDFFNKFIELELDKIFEKEINKYFKHFFSFVNNIFDFKLLFKLFNVEKMSEKSVNEYLKCLKNKCIEINLNIDKKNETQNIKISHILVELFDIIIKNQPDKFSEFFDILERKCNKDIYHIYIQILDNNKVLLNQKLISNIFSKIEKSDEFIEYSVKLLSKIKSSKVKKKFFESIKDYIIELTDFISDNNNKKLNLYITLNKNKLLDENTEYYINNKKFLEVLKVDIKDLNNFNIKISEFESFLNIEKEKIYERLNLIDDNPEILLDKFISKLDKINKEIEDFRIKKDILSYYHKKFVENQKEFEIISCFKETNLNSISENIEKIKKILYPKNGVIEKVKLVKDSILFNMIYREVEKNGGKNEDKIFNDSLKILDNTINIIKLPEEIESDFRKKFFSNFKNNEQLKKEIITLGKYYKIEKTDVEFIIDKINIIENIQQYIKNVENIIFFLDKIEVKKTDFYKNLKDIINSLKLLDNDKEKNRYNEMKKHLDFLKKENIFDYKAENDNLVFFRYLSNITYENIKYLLEKDVNTAKILEEKLDPMETTLTSDDLMFFVGCIKFIKSLNIPNSTDKVVFDEIQKKIKEDKSTSILIAFKNYSNSVKSIKELENYSDEDNSILNQIKNNINTGVYSFYKNFDVYKNGNIEIKNGYDILYDLKCKIKYKINIID